MRELVFELEFKSDILLPATSNTEGKIDQLDFVAGSAFLGMVAKKYTEFSCSFDVFHSGKVRFGDAHMLKDGKTTYKIPYSYCHKKLDSEQVYNHHKLEKDNFEELGQLKQLRSGYITSEKEQVFVEYTYSQKSAYDKEKRKSKDSQMYGYKAIKKGSTWRFTVKMDGIADKDEALIIETLEESKRLGKSKSAEYGEVVITYLPDAKVEHDTGKSDEVILYCNGRLALVDECGNPTYNLKYLCDGLGETNIDYKKTQIRTSSFAPYNRTRETKDYERVCINKGSVIVLKNISDEQLQKIKKGVGAYLAEGFGDIIVNPSFLMEPSFVFAPKLQAEQKQDGRQKITQTFKDPTVQFLANRHNASIDILDIASEVSKFIELNPPKDKLSSQWGAIRSLANQAKSEDELFGLIFEKEPQDKPKGFLRSKKAKVKWGDNLIDNLEATKQTCSDKKLNFVKFIKLLSIQMPKQKQGGKNDQK